MTLTPEQIQDFERRAEAGEKPQHPGWQEDVDHARVFGFKTAYVLCHLTIYVRHEPAPSGTVYVLYNRIAMEGVANLPAASATSLAAAQLAAEHLLREATAPLWAEVVGALEQIASQASEVREIYERIGPTWTGKDGHQYEDMSAHLNFADELGEAARATLARVKGSTNDAK